MRLLGRQLYWQDAAIAVSLLVFMSVRAITLYYFAVLGGATTPEEVARVATVLEANPVATAIFQLTNINTMLSYIIIPAFFIAVYVMFRNYVLKELKNNPKLGMAHLTSLATFFLLASLLNLTNDVSVLLGTLRAIGG